MNTNKRNPRRKSNKRNIRRTTQRRKSAGGLDVLDVNKLKIYMTITDDINHTKALLTNGEFLSHTRAILTLTIFKEYFGKPFQVNGIVLYQPSDWKKNEENKFEVFSETLGYGIDNKRNSIVPPSSLSYSLRSVSPLLQSVSSTKKSRKNTTTNRKSNH
jgi:hypothetical protein